MERINIERNLVKNKYGYPDRTWIFNSISDLDRVASIPYSENNKYSKVKYYFYNSNDENELNKTNSFDEARNLMINGWEEGARKINEGVKKIKLKTQNKLSFKSEYNVIGGNASVPRYLQGIPTNMIKNSPVQKKTKIINVYKSAGYSSEYTADDVMKEAAKAVLIIDMIEKMGYRCNLFIVKYNNELHRTLLDKSQQTFTFKIKIKDANERLNIKKMAFFLAHPDFQRRIVWRLYELHPDYNKIMLGYGRPIEEFYRYITNDNMMSNVLKENYSRLFDIKKEDIFIPLKVDDINKFLKLQEVK